MTVNTAEKKIKKLNFMETLKSNKIITLNWQRVMANAAP